MNNTKFCKLFVLLATLLAPSHAFGDVVLDFEGLGLVDGNTIPQSYGDNSLIGVSYRELDGFGNANIIANDLSFWTTGYGDMQNVVWGAVNGTSFVGEIRFNSLTADSITLRSFDAADGGSDANNQTFRVFDQNYNLLFDLGNFDVNDFSHDTITPNVSADTLILQWDYPWGVALDNISVASAVPEPSSLVLLSMCTGFYAFRRRRITMR